MFETLQKEPKSFDLDSFFRFPAEPLPNRLILGMFWDIFYKHIKIAIKAKIH
jgi:hypothetical protein